MSTSAAWLPSQLLRAFGACLLLQWVSTVCIAGQGPVDQPGGPHDPASNRFVVDDVSARPGEEIDVGFRIFALEPVSLVVWSLQFDPDLLEFVEPSVSAATRAILERALDAETQFNWEANQEEGWFQAALVLDYAGREAAAVPPGLLFKLATLKFRVRSDAPEGDSQLSFASPETATFESSFAGLDGQIYNGFRVGGTAFTEETRFDVVDEPELDGGVVSVKLIGDIGLFSRGDANLDKHVNIADPMLLLNFLFRGSTAPGCLDTADANQDLKLNIADPAAIFGTLFLGYSVISTTPAGKLEQVECPP